jgi:hypothetical protein
LFRQDRFRSKSATHAQVIFGVMNIHHYPFAVLVICALAEGRETAYVSDD